MTCLFMVRCEPVGAPLLYPEGIWVKLHSAPKHIIECQNHEVLCDILRGILVQPFHVVPELYGVPKLDVWANPLNIVFPKT